MHLYILISAVVVLPHTEYIILPAHSIIEKWNTKLNENRTLSLLCIAVILLHFVYIILLRHFCAMSSFLNASTMAPSSDKKTRAAPLPGPPMMPLPPNNNSNLMTRLSAFLPQMEAANEKLEGVVDQSFVEIIDKNDAREDASDDDDSGSDSDEEMNGGGATTKGQIIEMNVALGNFDQTVLAALDEEKDNTAPEDSNLDDCNESNDVGGITESPPPKGTVANDSTATDVSAKKTKVLIQEMN
jgi:hypothetical protein